jgi:hypothetical protein
MYIHIPLPPVYFNHLSMYLRVSDPNELTIVQPMHQETLLPFMAPFFLNFALQEMIESTFPNSTPIP